MLFFGPGDFSQGIGAPGRWDHPELLKARSLVAEIANKHGKFAGTAGSIEKLDEFRGMGYQFISVGADVVGLSAYFHGLINRFNKNGDSEKNSSLESYK
jgi:4-hydroxy-2-oxoheptanedioate aldolase